MLTPLSPPRQRLAVEGCGKCVIYPRLGSHGILCIASCCSEKFLNGDNPNSIHAYTRKSFTPSKPVSPICVCNNRTKTPYISSRLKIIQQILRDYSKQDGGGKAHKCAYEHVFHLFYLGVLKSKNCLGGN